MKKRVLIVSFKVGMGHIKAAAAIAEQFSGNNVEVKNVDLSDHCSLVSKELYQQGYLRMVNNVPRLYSFLYNHTPLSSTKLRVFFDSINATRLKKLISNFKPDVIVSTNFIVSDLISHWKESFDFDFKLLFVMTDYDGHPLLIDKNIDVYTVPSRDVLAQVKSLGAEGRLCVTGIPVGKNFNKKYFRPRLRSQFGLDNRFTILLMNGGFGVGKCGEILKLLCQSQLNFQVIVVAGHNNKLKNSLEKIVASADKKVKIFGFTDQISELMAASDLIISKAGGLTVSESLSIGTPILIFEPTPGQEEANSRFLIKNNAAILARTLSDIEMFISLSVNGVINLQKMRGNIKNIAMANSAFLIKKEILRLLQ